MTIIEELTMLKNVITEIEERYCEKCQEWDCDYCRAETDSTEPMARYIDADVLRDLIDGGYDIDFDELPETKAALLNMIDYQDTADVRENVRGEWIHKYTHESLHDRTGIWCSACGKDALQDSEGYYIEDCETDFCPNCGADMRGEKDGEI